MRVPTYDYRVGHVIDVLRAMPAESVQCVVTSPPYYGLRAYSGEQDAVWGGDATCVHEWTEESYQRRSNDGGKSEKQASNEGANARDVPIIHGFCKKCLAWKGSYGLEPSIEMYVEHTVQILREIQRVLRNDGTVWWNIGDSYSGSGGAGGDHNKGGLRDGQPKYLGRNPLKPKDLCLIPFRVALAAQADGWWVRSDIIWAKPNPMPESVTDRPTRCHEYIFLFTKSKDYYWDADTVREPWVDNRMGRAGGNPANRKWSKEGRCLRPDSNSITEAPPHSGRNIRSVWTITTHPYKGAHFATFPPKLVERCIKAGTSEAGCCPTCGTPWERIVEVKRPEDWKDDGPVTEHEVEQREVAVEIYGGNQKTRSISDIYGRATLSTRTTLGWKPACECPLAAPVPCMVLDPFCGSGTTLEVAYLHWRDSIGIDISKEYQELAMIRMMQLDALTPELERYDEKTEPVDNNTNA